MWFTNITVYQLHNAPAIDSITLHETLQAEAAKPLGNTDAKRLGWTPPAGRASTQPDRLALFAWLANFGSSFRCYN